MENLTPIMLIEQNEGFKEIVQNSSDVIFILDEKIIPRYISPSVKRIMGYEIEELIGNSLFNLIHPDDIKKIQERVATGINVPGIKPPLEIRARHKAGHWVCLEASYNNLTNNPNIKGIVVIARDITERKKIEASLEKSAKALRESESKIKGIFDSVPDGIIVTDTRGNIIQVNNALLKIYGYDRKEDIIGMSTFAFVKGTTETEVQIMEQTINKGFIKNVEYMSHRKDGTEVPIELSVSVLNDNSGNHIGFVTIVKDVSERKHSEEKLKESEDRLKNAFDSAAEGIALLDAKGKILDVNNRVANFIGIQKEKIVGKYLPQVLSTLLEDSQNAIYTFENILKGKKLGEREWTFRNAKGDKIIIRPRHSFIEKNGKITGLFYMLEDITQRKQTEESLKEAEERFKTLFDNVKDGIIVARIEDKTFYTGNQMICRMLGYTLEEFSKLGVKDIHPEENLPYVFGEFDKLARGEATKTIDIPVKRKNGSVFYADINCSTIIMNKKPYLVSIFTDVTERKRIESLEKLMILGQMAGGVAHEMRNPLGAIKNASYFLNIEMKNPKPGVKEALDILHKEVANSERIINSLLFFARPKQSIHRKTDINKTIKDALSSMEIPKNIKILKNLGAKLPQIPADSNQLVQVFENIILNAIQAMPEGGQLTIKSNLHPPASVIISFADKGIGISPGNLHKIFEPFFTTKAKGIGLGLSVSKILIEQHNGTITATSKHGKGSLFTIKLPIDKK